MVDTVMRDAARDQLSETAAARVARIRRAFADIEATDSGWRPPPSVTQQRPPAQDPAPSPGAAAAPAVDERQFKLHIPQLVRTGQRVAYIDLDGVICDDRHRVHFAKARDWAEYFGLMTKDTPWRQGRELYESAILAGWDVAFLTGRREDTRGWTVQWLTEHDYDPTLPLVMRPEGERMPLANLKAAVVTETLRFVPEVLLCDDDPEVIAAVAQVPGATVKHCTWHVKDKALIKKAQF